jgi:heptosyltransferase-2
VKILVETPTWLGDSVMLTPALKNLEENFPESEILLVGSTVSMQILEGFGTRRIPFGKNNRISEIKRVLKEVRKVDIALSFRTSPYSGILQFFSGAKTRIAIGKPLNRIFLTHPVEQNKNLHQVEKYLEIVREIAPDIRPHRQELRFEKKMFEKPIIGINAGATYGSAKRWYPEKFAEVIEKLSEKYDTILFGGKSETDIVGEIERILTKRGIRNFQNLSGKTSIKELAQLIGGLDLFVTNDSGPMHIAGAFGVPTVSIFGSTNHLQTNQWKNENSKIIRKDISCSPCMKRECPLKHHDCMKKVNVDEVISAIREIEKI